MEVEEVPQSIPSGRSQRDYLLSGHSWRIVELRGEWRHLMLLEQLRVGNPGGVLDSISTPTEFDFGWKRVATTHLEGDFPALSRFGLLRLRRLDPNYTGWTECGQHSPAIDYRIDRISKRLSSDLRNDIQVHVFREAGGTMEEPKTNSTFDGVGSAR